MFPFRTWKDVAVLFVFCFGFIGFFIWIPETDPRQKDLVVLLVSGAAETPLIHARFLSIQGSDKRYVIDQTKCSLTDGVYHCEIFVEHRHDDLEVEFALTEIGSPRFSPDWVAIHRPDGRRDLGACRKLADPEWGRERCRYFLPRSVISR